MAWWYKPNRSRNSTCVTGLLYMCNSANKLLRKAHPKLFRRLRSKKRSRPSESEAQAPSRSGPPSPPAAQLDWKKFVQSFGNLFHADHANRLLQNIVSFIAQSRAPEPRWFKHISADDRWCMESVISALWNPRSLKKDVIPVDMAVVSWALVLGKGKWLYTALLVSYAFYLSCGRGGAFRAVAVFSKSHGVHSKHGIGSIYKEKAHLLFCWCHANLLQTK